MLAKLFLRLSLPRSLRWQFTLALSAPVLLIVAGGLSAIYGWRVSSDTARQLAGQRLAHLQHAQDLVRHTLLLERESNRMLTADSLDLMQASYLEILERLDLLDGLVQRLGQASNNLAVLTLNQANQLFRNTVHIVVQLRRNLLTDRFAPPESTRQQGILLHFHGEMHRQVVSLVDSTYDLSARFTRDYQETLRQLTAAAAHDQLRVLALLAGSVILAWLVSRYFLGRRVVGRLQQVSNCLRLEETHTGARQVPVRGDDEIGNMARAVEQFLEDRRLLVQTQRDLQQNMDALRKSETRLQDIIDSASDWIWETDAEGVYTFCSGRMYTVLGYRPEEVLGRTPFDLMAPEERGQARECLAGLTARKAPIVNFEHWCLSKDGRRVRMLTNGVPIVNREGRLTGYRGADQDITEKKQAEAALALEREQLLSIFDSIDQIVLVFDPQTYEILYVNRAVKKAFRKDLVGGICYRDYQGLDTPCPFCTNEIILKQKPRPYFWEYYNSSLDKHFDVTDRIITWPDGREVRLQLAIDITDRKRLEDQLRHKNEDLVRSNAELEQFAYVASHDLQEPLRKVGSYMELVAERYRRQLDRDAREFIDYAVDGARRMKIMINDLLVYSRVGNRGQTFAPIDMMSVMHHVLDDLELAILENGAVVSYDALPVVTADNSQLQQLLRNLIGNALKYRGSDPPKIHVSVKRQKQTWRFSVKDNGIGIEPRFFERIFQIFQRLHPRGQFNGTGIGLAVCKKIVERHGGTIGVESTPGQGSTFYFTIADQKEDI
ncbi:MAG: PAS domain S-box protein [Desulfobacteraceae bacterium]|jgi:PAS domain S-box-containing protein